MLKTIKIYILYIRTGFQQLSKEKIPTICINLLSFLSHSRLQFCFWKSCYTLAKIGSRNRRPSKVHSIYNCRKEILQLPKIFHLAEIFFGYLAQLTGVYDLPCSPIGNPSFHSRQCSSCLLSKAGYEPDLKFEPKSYGRMFVFRGMRPSG